MTGREERDRQVPCALSCVATRAQAGCALTVARSLTVMVPEYLHNYPELGLICEGFALGQPEDSILAHPAAGPGPNSRCSWA